MPLYDYECEKCGNKQEVVAQMGDEPPTCCGVVMTRLYSTVVVRDSKSLTGRRSENWIGRIDDIHKRQADKGERLRFVHPSEVMT